MAKGKLNFEELIQRGNDPARKERDMPRELFQCAVFFGRPVLEELPPFQNWQFLFRKSQKEELENQRFVFPFYSKEIFGTPQEAEKFLPMFIQQLIKEEKIPEEVIKADRSVDDNMVHLAIVPLQVTFLEMEKQEFRSF